MQLKYKIILWLLAIIAVITFILNLPAFLLWLASVLVTAVPDMIYQTLLNTAISIRASFEDYILSLIASPEGFEAHLASFVAHYYDFFTWGFHINPSNLNPFDGVF